MWVARLLAVVALASGLYVSWRSTLAGPIPGCGGSTFDCDHVVTSSWSRWLGIPVGYLGCLTYACLLGVLCLLKPSTPSNGETRQRIAWSLAIPISVTAALSAVWFTYLQFFEIGKLCPYCLVTHTCGILILITLSTLVVDFIRHDSSSRDGNATWLSAVIAAGIFAAACLVLGQLFFPHETFIVEEEPAVVASNDSLSVDALSDTFASPMDQGGDDPFVFAAPGVDEGRSDQTPSSQSPEARDVRSSLDDATAASPNTEPERAGDATSADGTLSVTPADRSASAGTPSDDLADDLADIASAPTVVKQPPTSGRHRYFFYARAEPIDVYAYPMLGSPDAKNLVVEIVDYTCHHCREMYHHLEAVRQHFGDDVAIVVRPVALDKQCNPYVTTQLPAHENACKYVRLALAVWASTPEKFPEFHHWLMGSETTPDVATASAFAAELIGEERLASAVKQSEVLGMLGENQTLWNQIGGSLPLLFAGRRLIRGIPRDDASFTNTLQSLFDANQ